MAALPAYVKVGFPQGQDQPSVLAETGMERGVPKTRRLQADAVMEEAVTLYFNTKVDETNFEAWFNVTLNAGSSWFDWTDLRTGTVVQAQFVKGYMGKLVPGTKTWVYSQRAATLRWVRLLL